MTRNEARFGVRGTIGNLSALFAMLWTSPDSSYHLINLTTGQEVAIRYDLESIQNAYEEHCGRRFEGKSEEEAPREFFQIVVKPILREHV